ncbi:hypothetical protein GXP70_26075 [Paenibacillus lycopersici]|uniref:Uncharacterized protein n=1 Tax=Paenibacillus lycopersici TaxID=2704462 RepID=A0A6C0G3K4_9BACL|nr:hypothetical protein [Paenibacillus lycopersici]QHT63092.1 hypothetical protein GXP70_26075 [Paenibacillus lycopersici]
MKRLDGLAWQSFWNTQLGCLKGCTDYLGLGLSEAWLFGGTGAAFIALTDEQGFGAGGSWHQTPMTQLCNNLGFTVNGVYGFRTDEDFGVKQRMAWELTRNAIDRGYPCYGYNLAIPEYYVVNGYEERGYLFAGFGVDELEGRNERRIFYPEPRLLERLAAYGDEPYVPLEDERTLAMLAELGATRGFELKGSVRMVSNGGVREVMSDQGDWIILQGEGMTPWERLGTVHIGLLEMYAVEPGRSSGPEDTVKEALAFALEHAEGPAKWVQPPYSSGLRAYDVWIGAAESGKPNIFALSYNTSCWAECRKYAVPFLEEAAGRIGGEAAELLLDAAAAYRQVHTPLQAAADLLPFEGKSDEHYLQTERLAAYAERLRQAKRAEAAALPMLRRVAEAL